MRSRIRQRPILPLVPHKNLAVAVDPHRNNDPCAKWSCSIGLRDVHMMRLDRPANRALRRPVFGKALQRVVVLLRMLPPVRIVQPNPICLGIILRLKRAKKVVNSMLRAQIREEPSMPQEIPAHTYDCRQQQHNSRPDQQPGSSSFSPLVILRSIQQRHDSSSASSIALSTYPPILDALSATTPSSHSRPRPGLQRPHVVLHMRDIVLNQKPQRKRISLDNARAAEPAPLHMPNSPDDVF